MTTITFANREIVQDFLGQIDGMLEIARDDGNDERANALLALEAEMMDLTNFNLQTWTFTITITSDELARTIAENVIDIGNLDVACIKFDPA